MCLAFLVFLFWRPLSMQNKNTTSKIRYVSLGDSYSNGEGETPQDAWPVLLTNHLHQSGYDIELVANPAVSGWTTQNVIDSELPQFIEAHPTFATLLIGANDSYRGVDADTYRANLIKILDVMQANMIDDKKIILVTIPDYSVSPQIRVLPNAAELGKEIVKFNDIIRQEGQKRGLPVADLFDLGKRMGDDPSLVTADGLHPSAKELKVWEAQIYPIAASLLK